MKTMRKVLSLLIAIVLSVGAMSQAFAAEEKVEFPTGEIQESDLSETKPGETTLNIYKLQADRYKEDAPWDHTGGKINDTSVLGTNVEGLAGVKFTYYKVSEEQLKTLTENPKQYATTEKVEEFLSDVKGTETTATVEKTGLTSVDLAEGNYWFVESTKPETVSSSIAVPFGITLPLTNPEGTKFLKNVHIYPKNITGEKPEPDKTVGDLENKSESHNVGDVQTWYLQATVPANIKDYKVFKMTDKFSDSLSYKGNVVVKYGNETTFEELSKTLTETTHYEITQPEADAKGGTLEVKLTAEGIKFLHDNLVENGKLIVKVDTVINEDAVMGAEIPNGFDLEFTHDPDKIETPEKTPVPEDKKPKVYTGGKRFKKVAGSTPLADAIFQAFDGEEPVKWTESLLTANKEAIESGKFATKSEDGNFTKTTAEYKPEAGEEIYLRSDENGEFEIKGLEFSSWQKQKWDQESQALVNDGEAITHDWKLKEVKAPSGYSLLDEDKEFEVDKTSYFKDPEAVDHEAQDPLEIQNRKLTIPQTGGIGTVIFAIVGIALMGGAVIAMKKRNEVYES